jgi:adenosylcobyric acid synthase
MSARSLMFQGTGSDVGKSLLVAGLCRWAKNRGIKVQPFKPQNMSNNAAVAEGNGEVGRAQALQAKASRVAPTVDMNPILLKPETDSGAQIVVQGKMFGRATAREYQKLKPKLLPYVLESFEKIRKEADLLLVEGAGSTAEINLRANDLANMGFAKAVNTPVILIGDIDRGGVIANLVGTKAVLPVDEAQLIKGFVINKFRGDVSLFASGVQEIEKRTQWQGFGVIPWFQNARKLPAEDAVSLKGEPASIRQQLKISVPRLSRIANFDDLDPLKNESGVNLRIVEPGEPINSDADLILIPGSKSTIGDLSFLVEQGWDIDIQAHIRQRKLVLGICGGYQMLGKLVSDPLGIEGNVGTAPGLGLLDVTTKLTSEKAVTKVSGTDIKFGKKITGYEIHIGSTYGPDCARPLVSIRSGNSEERLDGASSPNGLVLGTYVHGLFIEDEFRHAFLQYCGLEKLSMSSFDLEIETALDEFSEHLDKNIDVPRLLDLAR